VSANIIPRKPIQRPVVKSKQRFKDCSTARASRNYKGVSSKRETMNLISTCIIAFAGAAMVSGCGPSDPHGSDEIEIAPLALLANFCSNSDPRDDRFVAGTVKGTYLGTRRRFTYSDVCRGEQVVEYWCANNTVGRTLVSCKHGCLNGACVSALSVLDYGAVADGVTDSGAAFQAALDDAEAQGGAAVYIPTGDYFIDRILLIGDHTTLFGDGKTSRLIRGNTTAYARTWGGAGNCTTKLWYGGRNLIWNKGYNCGNEGIILRDFAIDGSKVTHVPAAVMIALSGLKNSKITNLYIKGAPQDAIFLRNGGINVEVSDNTIDGFNMKWGNGAAINIEMWHNGNNHTVASNPVLIKGNTIIARGPSFCNGGTGENQIKPCDAHDQCASNKCGATAVIAINATMPKDGNPGGTTPRPSMTVSDNKIELTNRHYGIGCVECTKTTIAHNTITGIPSTGKWSGLFTGIQSVNSDGILIYKNVILGLGAPNDGRPILVHGVNGAHVIENHIMNKNVASWGAMIEARFGDNFEVVNNVIDGGAGSHGIVVGACGGPTTTNGTVSGNTVSMPTIAGTVYKPIQLRTNMAESISIGVNTLLPDIVPYVQGCP
jgi:hypothetical protein